jgi:hypothetical protein
MNITMMTLSAISCPADYALQSEGFTIRQTFIQSDREERAFRITPTCFLQEHRGYQASQACDRTLRHRFGNHAR